MQRIIYEALSGLPTKIVGGALTVGGIVASAWPEKFRAWASGMMTSEQIQFYGMIGIGLSLVYWALLAWLRPKENEGDARISQITHGASSPAIGEIHGNATFNLGPPHPTATQPARPPYGSASPPSIPPQRRPALDADCSIEDVVECLYRTLGPLPNGPRLEQDFYRRVDLEIADKAHQKQMTVWGRIRDLPIDRIGLHSLQFGKFDHRRREFRARGRDAMNWTIWTDLKFNAAEVKKVWPDA